MSTPAEGEPALPALRDELVLLETAAGPDGAPAWLVHDPVQNRFIRVGGAARAMLRHAGPDATAAGIATAASAECGEPISGQDVERFGRFIAANHLAATPAGGWRGLVAAADRRRHGIGHTALHNYLFFRVPLLRPEPFLRRTLPIALRLASPAAVIVLTALGLAGLYLIARQWDAFVHTAQSFFSLQGAAQLTLAIFGVKVAHEFGHAYAAMAFGVRVPTIGAAFIMMTPMLYCDVSDAWRLPSRRQRLIIDAAGVLVELGLAAVATFLWPFLPPGPARSVAFSVAAVSWIMSLGINLNPFMRFDGYHIAADWLRVENLQSRAFALGRWRLRECLLGLGQPPPERLPPRLARGLECYAFAVWCYRVVVFTGIALVVYHMFFKVLGLGLFLVEIVYFLVRPVWSELRAWWGMRMALRWNANVVGMLIGAGAIACGLGVPWSTRVALPAVLEAAEVQVLFAVRGAEVTAVHVARGQYVARGDPLVELDAPEIASELAQAELRLALNRLRLERRGVDEQDREESAVLLEEQASLGQRLEGLRREAREMVVRAPIAGRIVELAPALHAGRVVGRREPLAMVRAEPGLIVRALVEEAAAWRLADGAEGLFVPDAAERARCRIVLRSVDYAGVAAIDRIELASLYGGPVNVQPGAGDRLVPLGAHYGALADVADAGNCPAPGQAMRGIAFVEGRRESLIARAWRRVLEVLVRESGI